MSKNAPIQLSCSYKTKTATKSLSLNIAVSPAQTPEKFVAGKLFPAHLRSKIFFLQNWYYLE